MSIEAKATLLNGLERQLSEVITASDMSKVLSIVSDTLASFSVQQTDPCDIAKDDLMAAFVSAMQIQGRSEKTIERYQYIINRMMQAVRVPTRQITVYHLRQYLAEEKRRGISDRTLEGLRQVFSSYFNWLQRESLIESNPAANLGTIRFPKKIKTIYTEVDIEKMKMKCKCKRDRAIVTFLGATGCRISEMTQLNRNDVNLNTLECNVIGKGNKERTVFLNPVAGLALSEYLEEREDDHPALFIGKRRERLTPHGVRAMLSVLQTRTGVEHVHPHKFRRTLATTLIQHGMPIQEVAYILGHDKIDTTMEYVVLDKTNTRIAYRKYA